jgi:nitroimidazol reductase NimA-like FMN-containing flavoprotein (pyridoxamine 5'-phosphate oxidase superfamily)
MHYEMRRRDREESREAAERVIDKSACGILCTVDSDGEPYGVPVSFVREGGRLFFHCAKTGHKLDNLRRQPLCCVSFVGETHFPDNDFTVGYESAVVFGNASEVTDDGEKVRILRLICERFIPAHMAAFDAYTAKLLPATGVWEIHIDRISGKRRKLP